ncbi:hypothetical protein LIER_22779 [Lithospermum erythrorhizon]|uniref:Uncharacterized protein n=1 Tax=Lithospermum erythrorhizon TaxID=34254 RepID=A0AAV3QV09_LITER
MSQSSKNQLDNFVLRPRAVADQAEASIMAECPSFKSRVPRIEVRDSRLHKKWFYAKGGMVDSVHRIWTLKEEAKSLPIPSAEDMDSVRKLRAALPQDDNKRPWYTSCDETMLVAVGLVYNKVFSSQDKGKPPSWDKIANIVVSTEPKLVDFDDMLIDHPSLFARVAIIMKTKPRESVVPESISTSPPSTNNVLIPAIDPLLKRMATASLSMPPLSNSANR